MQDIIVVKRGSILTNSLVFSQEFKQVHRDILKKIAFITSEYVHTCKWFTKTTFINAKGREYEMYEFGKEGYMFLVMQMSSAKSKESARLFADKQSLFIQAFSKMEQMLLNQQNESWKTVRSQTKAVRRVETDTIQEFIEYAKTQGSSKAEWYYKHFTNATYKALALLEHKKPKTRDTLDILELNQLILAESVVEKVIKEEMEKGEHYKVIYEKCKVALEKFADSVKIGR